MNIIKLLRKRKFGFAMAELLAVVAIMSIIATISVPTVFRYVETGRQINRMGIARSLYLAAQNQLTELRITRNLDDAVRDAGIDLDTPYIAMRTNVFAALGWASDDSENWRDVGNEEYVHYVNKPAGYIYDTGDKGADFALDLLKSVVTYSEAIEHAILIEFNVKTGIVLSVIYTDFLPADPGIPVIERSFQYGGDDSDARNVRGSRVMGDNEYGRNSAHNRKQGYYGVENTGVLPLVIEPMGVNVFDSFDDKEATEALGFSIGNTNTLYALITITPEAYEDNHELVLVLSSGENELRSVSITPQNVQSRTEYNNRMYIASDRDDIFIAIIEDPFSYELVGYGIVWVLDHVAGNTNQLLRGIDRFDEIDPDPMSFITVSVRDIEIGSVTQSLAKYPYTGAGTYGNNYIINTARHLNNIRHINDLVRAEELDLQLSDYRFMQRENIDLEPVSHFEPLPFFFGYYSGNYNAIRNMSISNAAGNAGLFSEIAIGATVERLAFNNPRIASTSYAAGTVAGINYSVDNGIRNISVINPSISGRLYAGGVAGINSGTIDSAFVRYDSSSDTLTNPNAAKRISNSFAGISGAAGGIVGMNHGIVKNVTFVSPFASVHIRSDNAGGIVGWFNPVLGTIENALYLALAPMSGEEIVPITTVPADSNLETALRNVYYLSGRDSIRPSVDSINNAIEAGTIGDRNGYNMEPAAQEIGDPFATWELYEYLNQPEGATLPGWIKWAQPAELTMEQVLSLDNYSYYPYPFIPRWNSEESRLRIIPANANWPIVEEGEDYIPLPDALLTYYEIYSDGSWGYEHEDVELPLKNGDAVVANDGYAVRMAYFPGEYELRIGNSLSVAIELSESNGSYLVDIEGRNWITRIDSPVVIEGWDITFVWIFIPNQVMESAALMEYGHTITVYLDGEELTEEPINPLFAPSGTTTGELLVRSPRHIDNIDVGLYEVEMEVEIIINGEVEIEVQWVTLGPYLSRNFTQQLDLDFALYRKLLGWQGGSIAPSGNPLEYGQAVVTHGYTGIYNGNEREIRKLSIVSTERKNAQEGLFEYLNHGSVVRDLKFVDCEISTINREAAGIGLLAGENNGNVINVHLESSRVAIDGPDCTGYVGGIIGFNNGQIISVTVNDSIMEVASGQGVGGIAGVNNGIIEEAVVENSRVALTDFYGLVAGGIVGTNTDLIRNASVLSCEIIIEDGIAGGIAGTNMNSKNVSKLYRQTEHDGGIFDVTVRDSIITAKTEHASVAGIAGRQLMAEPWVVWDPDIEEIVIDPNYETTISIIKDAYLDGNTIYVEGGSAAAVVGLNVGIVMNAVYIANDEEPYTTENTVSGITRYNHGMIIDALFIAVASGKSPIADVSQGDESIVRAYYLSSYPKNGEAYFPDAPEYNAFDVREEFGRPLTTFEMNVSIARWEGWIITTVVSEESLLDRDVFPYPILERLDPPDEWPLAFPAPAPEPEELEEDESLDEHGNELEEESSGSSATINEETTIIAPEGTTGPEGSSEAGAEEDEE